MNKDIITSNKQIKAYSKDEIMQPYIEYVNKCVALNIKQQYIAVYDSESNSLQLKQFINTETETDPFRAFPRQTIALPSNYKRISFGTDVESFFTAKLYQEPLITIKGSPEIIMDPTLLLSALSFNSISFENKLSLLNVYMHLIESLKAYYNETDNYEKVLRDFTKLLKHYMINFIECIDFIKISYTNVSYILECFNCDLVCNSNDILKQLEYIENKTKIMINKYEKAN